jgi:hypothetical protein
MGFAKEENSENNFHHVCLSKKKKKIYIYIYISNHQTDFNEILYDIVALNFVRRP